MSTHGKDTKVYIDQFDATRLFNDIKFSFNREISEVTYQREFEEIDFDTRINSGGGREATLSGAGIFKTGEKAFDHVLGERFEERRTKRQPHPIIMIAKRRPQLGDSIYAAEVRRSKLETSSDIAGLHRFSLSGNANGGVHRIKLLRVANGSDILGPQSEVHRVYFNGADVNHRLAWKIPGLALSDEWTPGSSNEDIAEALSQAWGKDTITVTDEDFEIKGQYATGSKLITYSDEFYGESVPRPAIIAGGTHKLKFNSRTTSKPVMGNAFTVDSQDTLETLQAKLDAKVSEIFNTATIKGGIYRGTSFGDNGPVAWWKADGDVQDFYDKSNGAWLGAPTYEAGINGQGWRFVHGDGGPCVVIPNTTHINPDSFTIEGWYNTIEQSFTLRDVVVSKQDTLFIQILLGRLEGALIMKRPDGSLVQVGFGKSSFNVTQAGWHHWSMSFDADTDTVQFIGDNEVIATETVPGISMNWNTNPLIVGAIPDGGGSYFRHFGGVIDDIAVYSRALSYDDSFSIWQSQGNGKSAFFSGEYTVYFAPGMDSDTIPKDKSELTYEHVVTQKANRLYDYAEVSVAKYGKIQLGFNYAITSDSADIIGPVDSVPSATRTGYAIYVSCLDYRGDDSILVHIEKPAVFPEWVPIETFEINSVGAWRKVAPEFDSTMASSIRYRIEGPDDQAAALMIGYTRKGRENYIE